MNSTTVKQESCEIKAEKIDKLHISRVQDYFTFNQSQNITWRTSDLCPSVPKEGINITNVSQRINMTTDTRKTEPSAFNASQIGVMAIECLSQIGDGQGGDADTQMADVDLYACSPTKSRRPEMRNGLMRTMKALDDVEDGNAEDDDDEGGPVRSSLQKAKRQRQAYQTPQAQQEASDIRIGHHTAEPRITVFAKFKNETSDVTLDAELFKKYPNELPQMGIERKRQVIAEYLGGILRTEQPTINDDAPTPAREGQVKAPLYESRAPFIVGFHKDYPAVPVRAQLTFHSGSRGAALLFKLNDKEVNANHLRLPKLSVKDTQVNFVPEFARATFEETKTEILDRFRVKDHEQQDEEESLSPNEQKSCQRRSNFRESRTQSNQRTPSHPQIRLPGAASIGTNEPLKSLQDIGQKFLNMAFEAGEKLKKREETLVERETVVKRREEALEEQIAVQPAKVEDHAKLQQQLEQLKAQLDVARKQSSSNGSAELSAPHLTSTNRTSNSPFLDLNGMMFSQAYTKIPEGNPNTGWYWQNDTDTVIHHEGPLQGKKFTRNQVLQPITGITVPGRLKDTALRCGGIEYLHYEENVIAKPVQNSESVAQYEGQYYVCWTYLREIQKPTFKF